MSPPSNGCSTATVHVPLAGPSPATRTSPPTLTHAPVAPAASSSSATTSAARPRPMPSRRSTSVPAGMTTVCWVRSTRRPFRPGRPAPSEPFAGTAVSAVTRPGPAGRDEDRRHRRVVPPAGDHPGLPGEVERLGRLGGDGGGFSVGGVGPSHVAVRERAVPAGLQLGEAHLGAREQQVRVVTEDSQVGFGPHGLEEALDVHGHLLVLRCWPHRRPPSGPAAAGRSCSPERCGPSEPEQRARATVAPLTYPIGAPPTRAALPAEGPRHGRR